MRTVATTNSVYEINEADKLIRRVMGANDPTPRQGVDGVWQSYAEIRPHFDGLLIVYGTEHRACTWTSKVVSDTNG